MRLIKGLIRRLIASAVNCRLRYFWISPKAADFWEEQFKAWPAFFSSLDFKKTVELSTGARMELGIVDTVERTILTTGRWDDAVAVALRSFLHSGNTFVDIGANIGYFTLMASKLVGSEGTVVACEPSIRALRKLTRHLWLNNVNNVFLISNAIGSIPSTDRISLATESNIGGSSIVRADKAVRNWEPISIRRLDDICAEMKIIPDVIKIDIEGFEYHALVGAEQTLRTSHPIVICELTNQFLEEFGSSAKCLIEYMEGLGYHCFVVSHHDSCATLQLCRPSDAPSVQSEVIFSVDRSISLLP